MPPANARRHFLFRFKRFRYDPAAIPVTTIPSASKARSRKPPSDLIGRRVTDAPILFLARASGAAQISPLHLRIVGKRRGARRQR